jgi:hypothetical protein
MCAFVVAIIVYILLVLPLTSNNFRNIGVEVIVHDRYLAWF